MGTLFNIEGCHHFQIPDEGIFHTLETQFDRYRQPELQDFFIQVRERFTAPVKVTCNGRDVPAGDYVPVKKAYAYRKADAARFCALVHCCPENIRLVFRLFPESVRKAVDRMVVQGCVSESSLKEDGITDIILSTRSYSWDQFAAGRFCSLFPIRPSVRKGDENERYHYDREGYMYLPRFLAPVYTEALHPEMCDSGTVWSDEAGFPTRSAEHSFINSFPVLQGFHRQTPLKVNGMKMSAATAGRLLEKTAIPDVIPPGIASLTKVGTGQFFLPALVPDLEESDAAEDHVLRAVARLRETPSSQFYPAMLPHIKGFRSTGFKYDRGQKWIAVLEAALQSYPDRWLSLPNLCDFIHSGAFQPWAVGYTLPPENFSSMYLLNTLTGEAVLPDTQGREIDLELLRASAVALYGLGVLELALDPEAAVPDSPCGNVMQARLTPLGKYALGLASGYERAETESRAWFALDEERLVIRSLSGDNPYEALLTDTSVPIGGGKYVMDSASFLKNCATAEDVEEKVKFFEDYICADPPAVWKDFFRTLRQRCHPIVPDDTPYILVRLDPGNRDLVSLVTGEPSLRSLFIMAEDYRILVPEKNFKKLCDTLKKYGYLL